VDVSPTVHQHFMPNDSTVPRLLNKAGLSTSLCLAFAFFDLNERYPDLSTVVLLGFSPDVLDPRELPHTKSETRRMPTMQVE